MSIKKIHHAKGLMYTKSIIVINNPWCLRSWASDQ